MKNFFKILFKTLTILIFIIAILLSIGGFIVFNKAANAFITLKSNYNPIKIYDDENNLVSSDNYYYNYVGINDISDYIKYAFIAIEDKNFYSHNGFSPKGIIRAIYTNTKENNYSSGASTITQQYIKNVYLSNEKTIERKINEIAYAIELEKKYTKDQILEAYLNTILYGGNIYGVSMASRYYFNKMPNEINISEAAYLAGLIQAPNRYNAFKNPLQANERKNVVLKAMYDESYITEAEYFKEKDIQIKDLLNPGFKDSTEKYLTPYLDYINNIIINDENTIKEIYTYLDIDIQKDLYKIMNNDYKIFDNDKVNCSIVVLDNITYGIKAIAANRSFDHLVLNYATDIKLQPGSTIKPILDYAPAIEYLSLTPATIIKDEEYTYSDGTKIKNYDYKYKGNITLRYALKDSRNIPALKLFQMVGADKAFEFASKLGIYADDRYEANAIGGATDGYTLLSLANAYQAFANLGYYKNASAISKINYENYTYYNNQKSQLAMKPTTAWIINNILHDVFKGSSYDLKNTYLMAKTGQTNYDDETIRKYNIPYGSTKDSLLIAYTKDLTIGVWVGYDTISSESYLNSYEKKIPRSIMNILLNKYANDNQYYDIIDGIIQKYICIDDNEIYLARDNGYYEYFEKGTEPTSYIDELIKA
ncbi:MAG: transglycosylase domain-containing protein [Anaeroplasma sp.]